MILQQKILYPSGPNTLEMKPLKNRAFSTLDEFPDYIFVGGCPSY